LKDELVGFTYPKDCEDPNPDQIYPRVLNIPDAVSKDEV